jgi:Tfp pilus assembly protein PilN
MRALNLDYGIGAPWPRLAGLAVLVAGIAAALLMGYHYRTLKADTARWEARAVSLERGAKHASARSSGAELQQAGAEIGLAKEVVGQLTLPWDGLFQAVESANSDEVALLAIEPDAQKRTVKITGEAKNLAAMVDYLRQLEQQPVLTQVHLQHHQVQEQDAEKPVHFIVVATWRT